MTPQQEVLNNDLPHTEEFKSLVEKVDNLKQGQSEIKVTLSQEVKSQVEFKQYCESKFSNIESEIEDMKAEFKSGVNDIIKAVNDKELQSLKEEVRGTKEEKKLKKEFYMGIAKTILSGVVLAIVLYALSKYGITKP